MLHQENRNYESNSSTPLITEGDFNYGKPGAVLPADLEPGTSHYTYRRVLPIRDRTHDSHAEDVPVRIQSIALGMHGFSFYVTVSPIYRRGKEIVEDASLECTVAAEDGLVINTNSIDPSEMELGYFLTGSCIESVDSKTTTERELEPRRRLVPEPLKYFDFDGNTHYMPQP
ncbi:MAG: hypothetical protein QFB87_05575 [Patescibacteria group bacterium]|nr:hypothetical protein [Patescibacteria group bacterium]